MSKLPDQESLAVLSVVVLARHYYPSPGAATNRLVNMVDALILSGHKVTVVTRTLPESPAAQREVGPCGERIVRLPGDTSTGFGWRRAFQLLAFPVRAVAVIRSLDQRPDVVICDPPPTVGLVTALRRRSSAPSSIYYLSDRWRDLLSVSASRRARLTANLIGKVEDFVVRRADTVVAATHHLAEYAEGLNAHVVCLPNGVDGRIFTPEGSASMELAPAEDLPFFLYAGNFGEAHGAAIFANAAERLWREGELGFGLTFVGYGSQAKEVHEVAKDWPGRLRVIDPVQPPIVAAGFRGALAGLASVKNVSAMHGAIPVKALASIMAGCPLIYAGGGPFHLTVQHRGWGVACDTDVDQIARAMRSFLNRPWTQGQRMALGDQARHLYDNRAHHAVYQSMLRSEGRS